MKTRKSTRMKVMVIVAVVGVGLAYFSISDLRSGSASSRSESPNGSRLAYTSKLGHKPRVPAGASISDIISTIFGRYGGKGVISAAEGVPPDVPGLRRGAWLHFIVGVAAKDERVNRPEWESDLIEGAVADALAGSGRAVAGSTIDWKLPDGTILRAMGGGMGDILPGQTFSSATTDAIRAALAGELTKLGLRPLQIGVLHADQPAPAVIAETGDPLAAAAAAAADIRDLFGQDPPKYEGYYFEVRDLSGRPLFIQSASFRSGAGRLWISPTVSNAVTLNHG